MIALALALQAPVALAQQPPPPRQPVPQQSPQPPGPDFASQLFPPEMVMQQQRRLGLAPEQRTAITQAIRQLQGDVLQLEWQVQDEGQRLADLLERPRVDSAAALAAADRVFELERRVKRMHLATLIRIKNLLTPEQQAMLRQMRGQGPPPD
jgi:Spy/CpxP family protein refolding chaperone